MTESYVLALAQSLEKAARDFSREAGSIESATFNTHMVAVAAGRRALVVQVGVCGGRLAVSAWTSAVDRAVDPEPLPLLNLSQRQDRARD